MTSGVPISLIDRPSTSIFKTCVSRSVKDTWSVGKIRRGELLMRSRNIESTRRGAQTEPRLTIRIACTKSAGDAVASTQPLAPAAMAVRMREADRRRTSRLAARQAGDAESSTYEAALKIEKR